MATQERNKSIKALLGKYTPIQKR